MKLFEQVQFFCEESYKVMKVFDIFIMDKFWKFLLKYFDKNLKETWAFKKGHENMQ